MRTANSVVAMRIHVAAGAFSPCKEGLETNLLKSPVGARQLIPKILHLTSKSVIECKGHKREPISVHHIPFASTRKIQWNGALAGHWVRLHSTVLFEVQFLSSLSVTVRFSALSCQASIFALGVLKWNFRSESLRARFLWPLQLAPQMQSVLFIVQREAMQGILVNPLSKLPPKRTPKIPFVTRRSESTGYAIIWNSRRRGQVCVLNYNCQSTGGKQRMVRFPAVQAGEKDDMVLVKV